MSDDPTTYTIKMSHEKTYAEGFGDGYSRGWLECWDYLRDKFASEVDTSEPKPGGKEAGDGG